MTDGPQYLYLTTTGGKSGHPLAIEIRFVAHDGPHLLDD